MNHLVKWRIEGLIDPSMRLMMGRPVEVYLALSGELGYLDPLGCGVLAAKQQQQPDEQGSGAAHGRRCPEDMTPNH